MMTNLPSLNLFSLRELYQSDALTPRQLATMLRAKIAEMEPSAIWTYLLSEAELEPYLAALERSEKQNLPLYGIPFAVKDNLDLTRVPTTAACPAFQYIPVQSAVVVERLIAAGALPVGKTNMDQFATGLVGARSPHGMPLNPYAEEYLPGGSSSGSAVAVARELVSFALGTDTAGSGRIPAAFNNLVGHKPTRGLLSTRGLVPACRTLDCVSFFTRTAREAEEILSVTAHYDSQDPYSIKGPILSPLAPLGATFLFGVPRAEDLEFFGNQESQALFEAATARLEAIGGQRVEIDFSPFVEAARLLYEGPWVAERYVATEELLKNDPEAFYPITRRILLQGEKPSAADAFKAQYRLKALKRRADRAFEDVSVIVTPTSGTIYTREELEREPLQCNSNLGYYTNFMNLLDYAATAFPAGFYENGHPFGVTAFAPAHHDRSLLALAGRFAGERGAGEMVPPEGWTPVVVCGAHLEGLALNWQLTTRGGRLWKKTQTAPLYDFYALPPVGDRIPPRPGVVRVSEGGGEEGVAIEVEVWLLPTTEFGGFVAQIPAPLGIGKVTLAGGEEYSGFLCEPYALEGAQRISHLADWRLFLKT